MDTTLKAPEKPPALLLKQRMNAFLKEELDKNRLKYLVELEYISPSDALEIIDLHLGTIQQDNEDSDREYEICACLFRVGDKEVEIHAFTDPIDTFEEDHVWAANKYIVYRNNWNGIVVEENTDPWDDKADELGLPAFLNAIGFHHRLTEDKQLLERLRTHTRLASGEQLYTDAKEAFPGLSKVVIKEGNAICLCFETGAELTVSRDALYVGVTTAKKKVKQAK